jgi:hypothetical protein
MMTGFVGLELERIVLQEIACSNIVRYTKKEHLKHIVNSEKFKLMT